MRRFGFEEWLWIGLLGVAIVVMIGVTAAPLFR